MLCPIGTYGSSSGLTTPSCSGSCSTCTTAGYVSGSSSSLPSCISGTTFLSSATGTCINCRSCSGTGMVSISSCSLSSDAICGCAGGYSQSGVSGSNLLCTLCPAGSWSSQGSTSCSLCPPGTYSLAGASSCTLCPAGTFGNTSGLKSSTCSGSCSACIHNGSINIPPALPAPLLCPAGSWAPVAATSCLFCPPGTYSLAGASSCLLCPEGTYGSTAGLTTSSCSGTCIGCPPGSSFVSVTSLTSSILGASASPMLIIIGLVGGNILLSTTVFCVMYYLLIHPLNKVVALTNRNESQEEEPVAPIKRSQINVEGNDIKTPPLSSFSNGYRSINNYGSPSVNPELIVNVNRVLENKSPQTSENISEDPIVSGKHEARKAAQIEATEQEKIAEREIKKAVIARQKADDSKKISGRSDVTSKAEQQANVQERIAQREAMKARVARLKAEELSSSF
jgi:hypothetical protein